ncbi:hypothetical protein [Streptomyces sp. NBC_01483]|uniref:hypothetical protein n=1 Tax=Streptomyces sp. NBC_01483 TaxID=2903883 RepID=UPI002E30226A|nr:hypothetical protein [Streptomyces sp. NBC_01483]
MLNTFYQPRHTASGHAPWAPDTGSVWRRPRPPSGGSQGFTERAEADVGLSVFQGEGRHLG